MSAAVLGLEGSAGDPEALAARVVGLLASYGGEPVVSVTPGVLKEALKVCDELLQVRAPERHRLRRAVRRARAAGTVVRDINLCTVVERSDKAAPAGTLAGGGLPPRLRCPAGPASAHCGCAIPPALLLPLRPAGSRRARTPSSSPAWRAS